MSSTAWSDFAARSPSLARDVQGLLEQYGQGFGYLATVRRDGGPRVHPVSPVITDGGLYCFVMPSPKRRDLVRDGRYALHSYPAETRNDEAYVTGRARLVTDPAEQERVARAHRAASDVDWQLFELTVELAMVTHRDPRREPAHRILRVAVPPG
jgi:hypothetical protein